MNEQQQNIIKRKYGRPVVEFLNNSGVSLKEDRFGSYSLPKDFLNEKFNANLLKNPKRKFKGKKEEEILYPNPKTPDLDNLDNFCLFTNFRRSEDFPIVRPAENPEPKPSIKPTPTKHSQIVSTKETEKKIEELFGRNLNGRKPANHKSSTSYSRRDRVFSNIIDDSSPEYNECSAYFLPITGLFAKKHQQFRYSIFLDSIPQDTSVPEGQLTRDQVDSFFSKVLYKVVPDELFGSRKNRIKIRKTVKFYFETGNEDFTIEPLLKSLNINSIKWLKKVHHESSKIYLLAQVLNWLFDKFIWNIVYKYLYCEKTRPGNHEKRIFRRWVRRGINYKYMLNQVQKNVYEPIPSDKVDKFKNSPRLWLYAKKSGLRPILQLNSSDAQKTKSKMFQNIIKRLYLLHNPTNKHITQQVSDVINEHHKNNPGKLLYFVACDIKNAYGSIIQSELLKMVSKLLKYLPNKLERRRISQIKSTRDGEKKITEIECVGLDVLPPLISPGSLYCITETNKDCKTVSKKQLKEYIEANFVHKVIRLSKKYYVMKQGIGQGLTMSPVLSEIYYSDMVSHALRKFTKSGHLVRYVDDFVYLTDNEELAKEFLELTKFGIPQYNCSFNDEKTKTNLLPEKDKEFSFLGFRYNVETSEVKPEYSSIPIRYSINLEKDKAVKPNELLKRRLYRHLGWLKLFPLVTTSKNSEQSIRNTLKAAGQKSAERCFFLIINIFDVKSLDRTTAKQIFLDIKKKTAIPVMKIFHRGKNKNNGEFRLKLSEVKRIFWSEYLNVFKKNSIVAQKFIKFIKKEHDTALRENS